MNECSYLKRFEDWLDAPPGGASHVDDDCEAERPRRLCRDAGQVREDPRCLVRLQALELGLGREHQQRTTTPIPNKWEKVNTI